MKTLRQWIGQYAFQPALNQESISQLANSPENQSISWSVSWWLTQSANLTIQPGWPCIHSVIIGKLGLNWSSISQPHHQLVRKKWQRTGKTHIVRTLACKFSSIGQQQSTNLPMTVSVSQSNSQSVSQSVSKSVSRSVYQSVSQSVNQSVN